MVAACSTQPSHCLRCFVTLTGGVCRACSPVATPPALLWRILDPAHTRAGSLLIEVKHYTDDDTIPNYEAEHATSIASVDHDIDWHCDPEDHIHVLIGPEIHAMDRTELAEDVIRWICDAGTKFCADRMSGPQSTCVGNTTWQRARAVIAELEAQRDGRAA